MDSLTQIVLGAAVAEAVGGKKLGNKGFKKSHGNSQIIVRFFSKGIE